MGVQLSYFLSFINNLLKIKSVFPFVNLNNNFNKLPGRVTVYLPALATASEIALAFFSAFATART